MGWSNSGGWGSHGWSRPAAGGSSSLLNGIVAYWKLDDATGTSAVDATGNGNTGTLVNSPTWGPGKINDGVLCSSASSQYIQSPTLSLSGGSGLSISCWLNPSSLSSNIRSIWRADTITNFGLYDKNNVLNYYYNGSSFQLATFGVSLGWHFIVFTIDSSGNTYIYADGSQVLNMAFAKTIVNSSFRFLSDAFSQNMDGTIDEIGVWSRPLSSPEASILYNGGVGLQYPFA